MSIPALNIDESKIAVLIPCYNEEMTVGKVVSDFKDALPSAKVYVFDNNSNDNSSEEARKAGAEVVLSSRQGKGNVVKHMFNTVDADLYIMADSDDTYPAASASKLISEMVNTNADMVVGTRFESHETKAFRLFHKLGNKLISGTIRFLFSTNIKDVLSGYRVFSKDYVNSVFLKSRGFEVETEMTLQALIRNMTISEVPIEYAERPEGSISKLNTFSDGVQIFRAIFMIFKDYKPILFFSTFSLLFFIAGIIAGYKPIMDYITDRYVYHLPLAVLAASFEILSVVSLGTGFILNTITNFHEENQEKINRIQKNIDRICQSMRREE